MSRQPIILVATASFAYGSPTPLEKKLSPVGTSPGRLVETDTDFNLTAEHPKLLDLPGNANVLGDQFPPRGLTVNWEQNVAFTSEVVSPVTILKPAPGIQRANTLRLWNLKERTIANCEGRETVGLERQESWSQLERCTPPKRGFAKRFLASVHIYGVSARRKGLLE